MICKNCGFKVVPRNKEIDFCLICGLQPLVAKGFKVEPTTLL